MSYQDQEPYFHTTKNVQQTAPRRKVWLHILLFSLTVVSTIMAGTSWLGKNYLDITEWHYGFSYSLLILSFLSAHEFGHYFAARYHKIEATLPYYIPVPLPELNPFGTFGAVIRTKSPIRSRKVIFDVGVAGPLAGFLVCIIILIVGLATLPGKEYLINIHPEYAVPGGRPDAPAELFFGDTILYWLMKNIFANPNGFLPPMNEIYHYPFLCVGWFGLFVTSLNMLPIGQLDGGHISYAMFGEYQTVVAKAVWWFIVICGLGSVLDLAYIQLSYDSPDAFISALQDLFLPVLAWLKKYAGWIYDGWFGWLMWAGITRAFIRLEHPPIPDETPLDAKRMLVGWLSLAIFVLCFSYSGIYFKTGSNQAPVREEQNRERPIQVRQAGFTKNFPKTN